MDYANAPSFPDPFAHDRTFLRALLATALFRCWHILIFFGAWSTAICVISDKVKDLGIPSTLLTVSVEISFFFFPSTLTLRDWQSWYSPRLCDLLQNNIKF